MLAVEALKPSELYNKLRKEITGLEGPEELGEGYEWGESIPFPCVVTNAYGTDYHSHTD